MCRIDVHPRLVLDAEEVARVPFDFIGVFVEEDLAEKNWDEHWVRYLGPSSGDEVQDRGKLFHRLVFKHT